MISVHDAEIFRVTWACICSNNAMTVPSVGDIERSSSGGSVIVYAGPGEGVVEANIEQTGTKRAWMLDRADW
jgi:hypothetical protein